MKTLLQELHGFLFEYKRDVTEKILGPKIETAAKSDDTTLEKVLDKLEKADPTKNKQYVEWLCKQYIKQLFKLEDIGRVNEVLVRFEKIKNKLEQKDINKYDFHTLQSLMDQHFDEIVLDVDAKTVKGAKVLYNGPLGQLSTPTTKAAACLLGSGTKWCTAAAKDNRFSYYNNDGPLYIWKDKSGEKFQFHFESDQFMDDKDKAIPQADLLAMIKNTPVIKKLFDTYEEKILSKLPATLNKVADFAKKFKTVPWKELEDKILSTKDVESAEYYASVILKKPWPKGESLIMTDAKHAYNYALNVLKAKWPEAEKVILSNRHYGVLYSQAFNKSSFKSFSSK